MIRSSSILEAFYSMGKMGEVATLLGARISTSELSDYVSGTPRRMRLAILRQPSPFGLPLWRNSVDGNDLVGTRNQEGVDGKNLVGNTAAVEDYSSIFNDPSIDAKLRADFNTEMAMVDQVFKSEMQTWGLDVVTLRKTLEDGAKTIAAEFPEIKNEVSATAASLIKALELAVGGEGITAVLLELMNAFEKLKELEEAARAIRMHDQVGSRVEDVLNFFVETISSNPKTKAVVTAIGRQAIAGMQALIASHPEFAEGIEESLSAVEEIGIFALMAFSGCKKEQPRPPVAVENYSRIFDHPA